MDGGSIVATASLAGLVGMPIDAIYSLTKHAVVGFVRSVAPQLAPIRINAVCPGIADTPMIDQQISGSASRRRGSRSCSRTTSRRRCGSRRRARRTGECWFVQPGREPAPFRFPNVPGPRREGERSACRRSEPWPWV